MKLTNEHIGFIVKDLHYRGVVLESFQDEVVDHVCSAVEVEMEKGRRFIDAYHIVLRQFGHTGGLRQTQKQVLQFENQTTRLMLKNYLRIAFRNISKHRFYSLINIAGLAVGVAACLVITLYILQELSYDRHFANADRIYRLNNEIKFGSNYYNMSVTPPILADVLIHDYPEVEAVARLRQQGGYLVRHGKENFRENKVVYADSSFFTIFSLHFLEGNPKDALTEPNTVVISKSLADKYFPGQNALGQQLLFFNNWTNKVVGVVEDMPVNSHFHFDIFVSMLNNEESKTDNWLSGNFQTYMLLKEGSHIDGLEAKFASLYKTYVAPQAVAIIGGDFADEKFKAAGNIFRIYSTPLTRLHLYAQTSFELEPPGDITYIYLFGAVAFFILWIACINFMNLSTARSANRAKEVGIRKVLGSFRSHLVRQFLLESVLLCLFSFLLAVGLAYLALPVFNELAAKDIRLPFYDPWFFALLIVSALILGALAGIYPSLFLSAFKPVQVLKGKMALGMKSGLIRSGLVVFQFVISIFLIVATIAVQRQLEFIQHKKLGFNKEQILVVNQAYSMGDKLEAFKNTLLTDSRIISATITGSLPVQGFDRNNSTFWKQGVQPSDENMIGLQYFYVDHDYVKTLGMTIKEGRDFSRDFPADTAAVILNEAAVKAFGFGSDVIGKKIETFKTQGNNMIDKNSVTDYEVIGIVEDFHFESLKDNISPLILTLQKSSGCISFRFQPGETKEVVEAVETLWKKMAPGQPFEYSFLNEDFGRMYSAEVRLGKIFGIFAGLAIFIACLGLFALTAFTAEQRNKEIGIRKVLGASVSSIVLLLSKEFGKLIVIAFVVAAPISWLAVRWWLEHYKYKVTLGPAIYILAGMFAFIIAWLTMGYQSIKAASTNPVNVLRNE